MTILIQHLFNEIVINLKKGLNLKKKLNKSTNILLFFRLDL